MEVMQCVLTLTSVSKVLLYFRWNIYVIINIAVIVVNNMICNAEATFAKITNLD